MREFIQKGADEVAIVIYDAPLPPKYFRLTKRFIKTLFVAVPLFLVLLMGGLFFWGLGSRIKEVPVPELPEVMSESESKIIALEAQVQELSESNKSLTEKVAMSPGIPSTDDPNLMVIKKPYGMQNLLSKNLITLDQFEFVPGPEKASFKFQIISSTPEHRVSGHVLVFMISDGGLLAYPPEANKSLVEGIKYSVGETFAVSRLRPTNAEFFHKVTSEKVKFVIYIFNREGDLLLIKETESFPTGVKS